MSGTGLDAHCPDCNRYVSVLKSGRLARHRFYRGGFSDWCPQKLDPAPAIKAALRARNLSRLTDDLRSAQDDAESSEKRFLQAKEWHDAAQARLAAAQKALDDFTRDNPAPAAEKPEAPAPEGAAEVILTIEHPREGASS